jgi:hypothetical protein
VAFAQPAGGLAADSFTTTCSTQSGNDSAQAQGASPVTVTGLAKAQSYACTVTASNVAGTSPPSAQSSSFSTAGPPDAPTISSVTPVVGGVSVSWGTLSSGGSALTALQGRWSANSGSTWSSPASLPLTAPYTFSGLTSGASYVVQLRSTNSIGTSDWSASSAPATIPTVPTAPASPTCVDGASQTVLSWAAPSSSGGAAVTSYRYRRSQDEGASWSSANSGTSPLTVTGLVNGTSYLFQVAAVNDVGQGPWSASSAACVPYTVPSVPAAPTVSAGNSSVVTNWTTPAANGRPITSYVVVVLQTGTQCITSTTTCTFTGLTNGTAYTFAVKAVNAAGASGWSPDSLDATPYAAMPTPLSAKGSPGKGKAAAHELSTASYTGSYTAVPRRVRPLLRVRLSRPPARLSYEARH